jgi:drug/metabolite transporter (DMT)-like permease
MYLLLLVSFIWAFSFGLIKVRFAGVDPTAVAALRLAFALVPFLLFFRRQGLRISSMVRLAMVGAVQFGAMYVFYQKSYAYLQSYEVVLFTLFTPLYLTLLDAALERRWRVRYGLAAVLAVIGSGLALDFAQPSHLLTTGFLLMQLSNICFAAGQLAWRRVRASLSPAIHDGSIFALPFAGALLTALIVSSFTTDWTTLRFSWPQWATLAYLGLLSSGVCFFWWNLGATRVNAGTLAVFNNVKVPLGIACSLLFFGENANWKWLLIGGAVMAAAVAISRPGTLPP